MLYFYIFKSLYFKKRKIRLASYRLWSIMICENKDLVIKYAIQERSMIDNSKVHKILHKILIITYYVIKQKGIIKI